MSKVLSQQEAVEKFMPQIESQGIDYAKFVEIEARPAKPGEVIVSVTSDGKETTNTAKEGDLVLCDIMTASKVEYILNEEKALKRYKLLGPGTRGGEWKRYKATGECRAIQYTGENTTFVAAWKEEMVLKTGDMLATPLPQKGEVYRIAAAEFEATYKPKA